MCATKTHAHTHARRSLFIYVAGLRVCLFTDSTERQTKTTHLLIESKFSCSEYVTFSFDRENGVFSSLPFIPAVSMSMCERNRGAIGNVGAHLKFIDSIDMLTRTIHKRVAKTMRKRIGRQLFGPHSKVKITGRIGRWRVHNNLHFPFAISSRAPENVYTFD